ncbi:MAG: N-glycosylase/DNA lyase [Candidatus Micrarchaeia archaeon]
MKSEIKSKINLRLMEFKQRKTANEIFKELCFCILTANYTAEGGIRIQKSINNGFLTLNEEELKERLKKEKYRFPNIRADYIYSNRNKIIDLKKTLEQKKGNELREWIVKNIKGIGYKEASHFLRNIGYLNYAIIDFHIIDLLVKHKLIKKPKTLTKNKYLEIEKILTKIAKKLNITLGELDLYLWYIETGKVLK